MVRGGRPRKRYPQVKNTEGRQLGPPRPPMDGEAVHAIGTAPRSPEEREEVRRSGVAPPPSPAGPGRPWDLEASFAFCTALAEGHYENFPVGSRFIPRAKRPYVHALYGFARTADDFADEARFEGVRLALLDEWEELLRRCYQREASHPVFIALRETVGRFDIPIEPLRALLQAYRMDVLRNRHETFEDLLFYCRHSANPVGQLVLYLFGYRDRELHALSDAICTALQLTNFWQDVDVDRAKDRVYLPQADMARFGYSEEDLFSRRYTGAFVRLLRLEAERTWALFEQGRPLLRRVGRDLRFEMRLTWLGGTRILRGIEGCGFDVFSHRPTLNLWDKLSILAQAALGRRLR